MRVAAEPAAEPMCTRCRSAPPMVPRMSVCRACLKAQVDAERKEREQRMRRMTKERRQARRAAQ